MIKIGITGGETKIAGELLRLALNHPDIDISTVYSPANAGKGVGIVHHGFIGEEKILFSSNFDASALDIAFLVKPIYTSGDWAKLMADNPELKLVLMPESVNLGDSLPSRPIYGLSEMNRKPLVRGARVAYLPNPAASMLLVALYPLARHLMLPESIEVNLYVPEDMMREIDSDNIVKEVIEQLLMVQTSFKGNLILKIRKGDYERGMKAVVEMSGNTEIEEIMRIYDSIYDDHNFTYMTTMPVKEEEVEGTEKIILSFSRPSSDKLRIEAVADARMRGGAGEAIHLLNLLFNLHEKTGLQLKASKW